MPSTDHDRTEHAISTWAQRIVTDIDSDIKAGTLPASVRSFSDLHRYLDANDYLETAGVTYDGTQDSIDRIQAVQEEVTRRLSAPGRPWCTAGRCRYPGHDHTTMVGRDGQDLATPIPMRCDHCGQPAHYDDKLGQYRHDNPAAADCFLISRTPRD